MRLLASSFGANAAAAALVCLACLALPGVAATGAHPHRLLRTRSSAATDAASPVDAVYDYVVVGGGQSGLVVANRLSASRNVTVLVVEYGYFDDRPAQVQPASAVHYPPQDLYNLTSVPQMALDGSRQPVYSAAVVGGGSTVNGMMLNRGAADDYDNWARLQNPGWGWADLLPYFVKSTTFQAPSPSLQKAFNITWNASAYGTDGPIHVSYAPFQWPGVALQYQGLVEMGAVPQLDGADGHGYGAYWFTSAVDNTTETRSYARTGYYDPVRNRTNLRLLTGWRVNTILFNGTRATGISMQARQVASTAAAAAATAANTTTTNTTTVIVRARREIVLAAGALHSPQILQRSGIGPAGLLQEAGIDVLMDLPGVGSNLQDHPVGHVQFDFTHNVVPNPDDAHANATFAAWAQAEWTRHRAGPQSQTVGNTAGLLPLSLLLGSSSSPNATNGTNVTTTTVASIVAAYLAQDARRFLPVNYTADQVRGYEAQRALLAASLRRDDNAVIEFPLQATGASPLVLTKALSRGTVLLDPTDPFADNRRRRAGARRGRRRRGRAGGGGAAHAGQHDGAPVGDERDAAAVAGRRGGAGPAGVRDDGAERGGRVGDAADCGGAPVRDGIRGGREGSGLDQGTERGMKDEDEEHEE
ncbi:Glucose-methanol-choline oxidoreductase [Niveomyces insectorum RCEF 264]|uniref:Glucose-methanol-choline oxidoreductase n=1 Tax=Niveomyces insectorum RCEF 264 TaxID=1081102 RepID=A0A167MEX7_9HYPO|nr:Glucose-methanol-choline oxidoreductase [Niveomyces insectorum RCEF 264]